MKTVREKQGTKKSKNTYKHDENGKNMSFL